MRNSRLASLLEFCGATITMFSVNSMTVCDDIFEAGFNSLIAGAGFTIFCYGFRLDLQACRDLDDEG